MPKAPKSTLANERFIALLIIIESKKPEVPSSAPAMMSTLLLSAKPVADAARPAYELSSEMTTGMSAPPMGSTASDAEHEARAAHRVEELALGWDPARRTPASPASRRTSRCSMKFWPLKVIGAPVMKPCSLPKAIKLPVKVREPEKHLEAERRPRHHREMAAVAV